MTTGPDTSPMPTRVSLSKVIADQRKTELLALGMMIFSIWFGFSAGWLVTACIAGGVLLGLVNHLATEYWLLKVIAGGGEPTRGQLTRFTIVRLCVVAIVAVGIAVVFWPDGVGVLLGLAIFRLVALVMTTIPLLKELKEQ
ncbi:hypothetical protein [Nocardioides sp. MH1]|uniref:hypothetical protein n=1 Tax=Nocardioides sp. MH1 TaxID=3242490 RepID=UPI003521A00C